SDTLAQVLDAETGRRLAPAVRQPVNSTGVGVSPDGRRLTVVDVSARLLRLIDVERGERILSLPCLLPGGDLALETTLWFDDAGSSLIAASSKGIDRYPIPRFDVPFEDAPALLRFLTGQEIDEADGIGFVDQFTFKRDPGRYRDVFLRWKASRAGGGRRGRA